MTAGIASAVPVSSPDGKVVCDFDTPAGVPTVTVRYANADAGRMAVAVRSASFTIASTKPVRTVSTSVKPVWGTAAAYPENYCELEVALKDGDGRVRDGVTIRAYNEGVAVQASHRTELYGSSYRSREASSFTLPEGTVAWGIPGTEATFGREPKPLADMDRKAAWRMPFTMKLPGGVYASLFEANVRDYPRSNLKTEGWTLKPVFAQGGHDRRGLVKTPWRALLLAPNAGGLVERAYLAELLNDPCAIADTSWIKPGKTTLPWWCDSACKDDSCQAGNNFWTNKQFVDFAAEAGFQYHEVYGFGYDSWYCKDGAGLAGTNFSTANAINPVPTLDIPQLMDYAKTKNVEFNNHLKDATVTSTTTMVKKHVDELKKQ